MLPVYILSRYNVRLSNVMSLQWVNITVRSCTSSSDSSSSDSDSDNEKAAPKRIYAKSTDRATSNDNKDLGHFLDNMIIQQSTSIQTSRGSPTKEMIDSKKVEQKTAEPTKGATNLMEYINNMMTAKKLEKTIDVAMPKKPRDKSRKDKHMTYEKQLTKAAENVADTLGGDKTKTTSDLLQKVLESRMKILEQEQSMKRQEKARQSLGSNEQEDFQTKSYSAQRSVIHDLLEEYKKTPVVENSISKQLLNDYTANISAQRKNDIKRSRSRQSIDLWGGRPSSMFDNMGVASSDVPELKTWTVLQQKELKALTIYPPANIFQEMILWTEQEKLWKFPIDNEQGMEEEHSVHFSEHVFLERHLKDWCPKSGPIRHFMELVCNGMSKNPYMTVQEKINHITWYKEYFESKQNLLEELGAIQGAIPNDVKEIQE